MLAIANDTTLVLTLIVFVMLIGRILLSGSLLYVLALLDKFNKKFVIPFKHSWLVFFCATWKYKEDPVLIPKVPSPSMNPIHQFGLL